MYIEIYFIVNRECDSVFKDNMNYICKLIKLYIEIT